jgi:subtilase family serine protease
MGFQNISLLVVLKIENFTILTFVQIATPGHELYGRHLSQNVIDDMVAPKDESLDLVMKWLESQNLGEHSSVSSRRDSVIVEASISQVEQLLKAEYSAFCTTLLSLYAPERPSSF